MDEFFKMDIFFVVTTVTAVLCGALLCTLLFYVIRIMRSVDKIAKNVSDESELLRGDIAEFRSSVRSEGLRWKHLSRLFFGTAERTKVHVTKVVNKVKKEARKATTKKSEEKTS